MRLTKAIGIALNAPARAIDDALVAEAVVPLLRVLALLMALLDPVDDGGVLGCRPDRLGDLLELVVGDAHLLGGGPQLGLVLLGELAHQVRAVAGRGEVGTAQPQAAAGTATIDAGVVEKVDAAVGRRELLADVGGRVDVDDAVAATRQAGTRPGGGRRPGSARRGRRYGCSRGPR